MDEVLTESIQRPRLLAQLLATFSALALLESQRFRAQTRVNGA